MSVLKNIESAIKRQEEHIEVAEREIAALGEKRRRVLSLTEICPSCDGDGQERYTDAAGSGDWRDCGICRGLGKVADLRCPGCGQVTTPAMRRVYRDRTCPWCGRRLSEENAVLEKERDSVD